MTDGISERAANHRGKQPVLASEEEAEIDIFDDVAERIDGHDGQEQAGRPKDARVAYVENNDRRQHSEPENDDHPIDQRCCKAHGLGS